MGRGERAAIARRLRRETAICVLGPVGRGHLGAHRPGAAAGAAAVPAVSGVGRGGPVRELVTFFATLKRELEDIDDLESWEAANLSIGEYIEGFYNPCRRHSALNYNSPIEFELMHSVKKAGKKAA